MRRRIITVVSALALALPAAGAAAQPEGLLEAERLDQRDVAVQVRDAAEAAKQHSAMAVQRQSGGERPDAGPTVAPDTARRLDDAVEQLVADGAVGVTARVESPGLVWAGSGDPGDSTAPHPRARTTSSGSPASPRRWSRPSSCRRSRPARSRWTPP